MFIDSVVWIGAKLKRDQWHGKSVPIIRKFLDKEMLKARGSKVRSYIGSEEEIN